MTPERWREVERVYHAALAEAPEARPAFLAEACRGDSALRGEVESLLAHASTRGVLDQSIVSIAAQLSPTRVQLTGRRLGEFDVQGLLGVGGMGEVYRARDTRLGRDVAIKILPPAFKHDPSRVARFEREARVLASLNHPHIAAIYGVEEADDVTALVMELVEGDDLSRRKALSVDQALAIARQVAEAIEAAHEQGVIHRDLKPANIKVRPDGTAKVLDFGLATALVVAIDGELPTRTVLETQPGAILGTPAYMSPEQARGEIAGRQADIWAFGILLYELLTGISPFARATTAETMASVLGEHPDYSRLPHETPANVRHLIRRCLEKDRKRRLQHIGDARLELEEALSPSALASSSEAAGASNNSRAHTGRRTATLAVAVMMAGIVLGIVGTALWLARRPGRGPIVRTMIAADVFTSGTDRSFAFTVDSSGLGYVSSDARQILVRSLDALEPVPILTTAAYIKGILPSPDGRWFGYIENNFTLKKISVSGGPPFTILTMDGPSRGAAWGPDDTVVFTTGASDTGLQRVASGGGAVTVMTRPDRQRGEADHVQPAWLPGGRSLLFTIVPLRGGLDAAKIAALDLETGLWHTVLEGGYGARYADTGHLVYAAAGGLWATRFDPARLQTRGAPREVLRPVSIDAVGAGAEFDIAANGSLAYSRGAVSSDRRVPVWVGRDGRETPVFAPPDNYNHPRISPQGARVAIVMRGDIYLWEPARPWSAASRLTFEPSVDWFPVWTPDSRRIVFGSWRGGGFSNLYTHDTVTGVTERLTDSPDMQLPTAMTPDGSTLLFHSFTKSLQALPMRASGRPITLLETPLEERNGELSPDGRWLAYEGESTSRPGEIDVYVRSFPDVDRGLWQVTRGGGMFPVWARNGRELFYVTLDGTMAAVPVEAAGTSWKAGSPVELFRGRYAIREGSLGRLYDVGPDGRFLMLKDEASAHAPHLVVVQNWTTELRRLVP